MRFLSGLSCAAAAWGEGESHYSNDKCTEWSFFSFLHGVVATCALVNLFFLTFILSSVAVRGFNIQDICHHILSFHFIYYVILKSFIYV